MEHLDLSKRVNSLDEDVKTLTKSMGSLESDMKNVAKSVDTLSSSLQSLFLRIENSSKTNWGILGTWAAVIISLIGSIGWLSIRPMDGRIERERFSNIRQYDQLGVLRDRAWKTDENLVKLYEKHFALQDRLKRIEDEQLRRTNRVYGKHK